MVAKRRQLLVDKKVQGAILVRVFVYWLFCVLFVMTPILLVDAMSYPEVPIPALFGQLWGRYWLSVILATLLLPMALMDALRLSHGFIGPLVRLRRELDQQTKRTDINFSKIREGDFWGKLAVDVTQFTHDLENDRVSEKA